ncbi:Putative plasma membrane permease [Komagataella phaffii CBS 7435]|uniref:Plasma membrane permease proposed to be involved in carboxylic acid uptake n=2 Tax=Komagataella phaffii TaxID=460519 RepID=C4QWN5_KOMPG|nr:Putative plasma membrane permease proposed to be involved in carboxylic acid uptake [Komagataella phaffii GS115]AOA60452.1 GQ67_02866T0 [Komagataella phaffii]CAH2446398.1 Putative plasma membrane permease [Komagataella phaffii CBS 7435]AOA65922.1 GQ68_02381T0 [Komagataella phaffii GS115]CAY67658.1 Putative plasma membrane permease proposed to be involved in carboxylic acid uptake [Komagataella phaffii GS115]CCA36751.1 Putative plasma membrane permease [Komagataella phaffii CBS 7435]
MDHEKRNSSSDDESLIKQDEAFKYLKKKNINLTESITDLPSKLKFKIDIRVMTILSAIYFLQFIDKFLLNYAAVMGIKDNLVGNQFNNLSTIFYVAQVAFEAPVCWALQKFPPATTIATCVTLWGIVVACHAACDTYASLMVIRALLGALEAVVVPGLVSISVMWYTKNEQMRRVGVWSVQSGTASIVGGLLSFAFQHVTNARLQSWQIYYLVMGVITFLAGLVTFIVLPNNPMSARFLSEDEKLIVLEHIRENQTGTETKHFKKNQLVELFFKDPHTWPMFFLTVMSMCATGALGTFSVTIISQFGFTSKESALVQMPVGVAVIISILGATYLSSKVGHRTWISISLLVPSIVGYIMLLSLGDNPKNKVGKLLAIYLLQPGTCIISMIFAWNGANTAGYTKKLARNCFTMIGFALGCLIGPQMFRIEDAPNYYPAKIALLVLTSVCIPTCMLIRWISKKQNAKREKKERVEMPCNYEFMDLTDIENPFFRYSY